MKRIRMIVLLATALACLPRIGETLPVSTAAGQEPSSVAGPDAASTSAAAAAAAEMGAGAAVQTPSAPGAGEARPGPVVPAYSDARQRSAVIVFYIWLWFSIAVLVYLLRLWIFEADRVYKAKYYDPEVSPRKDSPLAPTLGD